MSQEMQFLKVNYQGTSKEQVGVSRQRQGPEYNSKHNFQHNINEKQTTKTVQSIS